MDQMNGSEFADMVVEDMGWPAQFKESPLLRSALEFALSWAYEKWRRGHYGPTLLPHMFATEAVSIAENDVIGRIDLITNWDGDRGIQQLFFSAVAAGFEEMQNTTARVARRKLGAVGEVEDGGASAKKMLGDGGDLTKAPAKRLAKAPAKTKAKAPAKRPAKPKPKPKAKAPAKPKAKAPAKPKPSKKRQAGKSVMVH